MSVEGVDYSKSHPTPAELKAAGKHFAVRYLTGITTASPGGKNLTANEAEALWAAGIDIVSNVETTAGFLMDGYDATARLAAACWRQHKWCGGPDSRPLYFSLDVDATLDQYKIALQGLKGAGSAIGWSNVGLYGGLFPIDWAHQDGVRWLWQALGWSYGGGTSTHALIRQYHNNVTLGSGVVDYDRAFVADYGQWHATTEGLSMADAQDILNAITTLRKDLTVDGTLGLADSVEKLYSHAKNADIAAQAASTTAGQIKTLVEQGQDPAALAALLAGALEITGITTDPGGIVNVTFGPKPA